VQSLRQGFVKMAPKPKGAGTGQPAPAADTAALDTLFENLDKFTGNAQHKKALKTAEDSE
jgi:hypothetical protein